MHASSLPSATLGALTGAVAAFVLGSSLRASHPELLVSSAAAAGAWLGFLRRPRKVDLLIFRLLLASNLVVYGFATGATRPFSIAALVFAAVVAVGALYSYYRFAKRDQRSG